MNDYGSTSKSRPALKSPNTHPNQDPKLLKKKYEQAKQALRVQKKTVQTLQATVRTLKDQSLKQQKQLNKKEEQIEILLQQIKYLKNVIAQSKSKKSSKEISSYQQPPIAKSTHSEEAPMRTPIVGGYFGSVFN